jgi:formate hydrogenlyase subunit 4
MPVVENMIGSKWHLCDTLSVCISGTNNPYITNNVLGGSASWYFSATHILVAAAFFMLLLVQTGLGVEPIYFSQFAKDLRTLPQQF